MSRDGQIVPDESSLLCESCGYILDGLPQQGRCPECGSPIEESHHNDGRRPPAWEDPTHPGGLLWRFICTTASVIFHTRHFYRTLATRLPNRSGWVFASIHWLLSAMLLGYALLIHLRWCRYMGIEFPWDPNLGFWATATAATFGCFWATTVIASRLTAWEAAYRGIRLPLGVVRRGLSYHAAHYLPVAVIGLATIWIHWILLNRGVITAIAVNGYLFTLCSVVLLSAGYLFKTYWAGMKQMMWANR